MIFSDARLEALTNLVLLLAENGITSKHPAGDFAMEVKDLIKEIKHITKTNDTQGNPLWKC